MGVSAAALTLTLWVLPCRCVHGRKVPKSPPNLCGSGQCSPWGGKKLIVTPGHLIFRNSRRTQLSIGVLVVLGPSGEAMEARKPEKCCWVAACGQLQ